MKKNIHSDEFIKDLMKGENTNWLKAMGWIAITLFAGYESINSAFKVGMYKGSGMVAEMDNNNYAIEDDEN